MSPITSVRSATGEEPEKDRKPVEQIVELLNQGQEVVVGVKLDAGETGQDYRVGVAQALDHGGVKGISVSKIELESDQTLSFRVRKEGI